MSRQENRFVGALFAVWFVCLVACLAFWAFVAWAIYRLVVAFT